MVGAVAELRHHIFIAHSSGAGQFQDKGEWVSGPPLPTALVKSVQVSMGANDNSACTESALLLMVFFFLYISRHVWDEAT